MREEDFEDKSEDDALILEDDDQISSPEFQMKATFHSAFGPLYSSVEKK